VLELCASADRLHRALLLRLANEELSLLSRWAAPLQEPRGGLAQSPLLAPVLPPQPLLAPLLEQLCAGAPGLLVGVGECASRCAAAAGAGAAAGAAFAAAVASGHGTPPSKVVVRHVRDPSRAPMALCRADSCVASRLLSALCSKAFLDRACASSNKQTGSSHW
jgi:hypothetical protein